MCSFLLWHGTSISWLFFTCDLYADSLPLKLKTKINDQERRMNGVFKRHKLKCNSLKIYSKKAKVEKAVATFRNVTWNSFKCIILLFCVCLIFNKVLNNGFIHIQINKCYILNHYILFDCSNTAVSTSITPGSHSGAYISSTTRPPTWFNTPTHVLFSIQNVKEKIHNVSPLSRQPLIWY